MPKLKDLIERKEDYELVLRRRGLADLNQKFEEGIKNYNEWKEKNMEIQEMRARLNKLSKKFNETKDKSIIQESREVKEKIKAAEEDIKSLESSLNKIELMLPNWIHEGVPDGEGEEFEKPISYSGNPKVWKDYVEDFEKRYPGSRYQEINYEPFHHYGLVGRYIDQEKAGELAMSRFYYLFDELAILDLAVNMYSIDFFRNRGFTKFVIPPFMMRRDIESRIAYLEAFKDTIFPADDDMILIPSSEHGIVAYYDGKLFDPGDLPIRVLAWSPCFRKEAGAHGKDTRGIFRVRQFLKTELHSITKRDKDLEEVDMYTKLVQEFLDSIGLPNRAVIVPSKDMDKRALIQVDVETWFPAQGRYRETHSIATMGTWVSEKLKIRYGSPGGEKELVRNVYSTGAASERLICAIAENFYDPESNTIIVPKPLQKYTLGIKEIPLTKPVKKGD